MHFTVQDKSVYAYTGTKPVIPTQRTVVFIHGAANDHSVWALQSRYFAYHGRNVLAVDLPGHGKSAGPALPSIEALAA
jgi:pimeloyl-ACP methyl ester carboxylesterase